MKVKVNLSNQTLEYMDSQPYIQGTDTRNKLSVYIEHSTIPQTEGAFNIMIAYALQNGRTTIKMANTGATAETIDDVLYDIFYFTAPSVLTSVAGNFVATLILKVNTNLYKVNVLNTVLNAVEFEAFEDALDDTASEVLESLESMAGDITSLQLITNTLNTEYTNLMNNIVELSGTSGTLTTTQKEILNHVSTNMAFIVLGTDVYKLYSADENNVNIVYYATFTTSVSDNVLTLNKKLISINLSTNAWELITTSTILPNTTITTGLATTKQDKSNLVTSWQSTPDDTHYPSEKLVKDSLNEINNEIGYIEVNGESGTLTNDQYAECLKPYCIIKLTSGIYSYTYFKYIENSQSIFFAMYGQSESKGTYYIMHRKGISIGKNISPKIYEVSDAPIYYYNMNQIDSKVINLQNNIDASGHSLALAIDSDFKLTAILKDANNNTISTSNVIDLPLESVVVSGAYDSATKKVVLTLENGDTIEFSVADLVGGLQTEITAQNPLDADLVKDTNSTHKFVTASEKAVIDEIGYIELINDSGTLTDAQYAEALKNYCVIKLGNDTYYKIKDNTDYIIVQTEVHINNSSDLVTVTSNQIKITKLDKSYVKESKASGTLLTFSEIYRFLNLKEDKFNKVTSLSSASTNTEYPSAKCVYDLIGDVETLLASI